MRKKQLLMGMLVCIILVNCTTITTATREQVVSKGNIKQIALVEKDFIVVGMIFLTSSATIDANGSIIDGSPITYEMLLKEAQKLDADDIANLRIDEIQTNTEIQNLQQKRYDYGKSITITTQRIIAQRTITYNVTALAIKYINK
jgi:hypothetical protein